MKNNRLIVLMFVGSAAVIGFYGGYHWSPADNPRALRAGTTAGDRHPDGSEVHLEPNAEQLLGNRTATEPSAVAGVAKDKAHQTAFSAVPKDQADTAGGGHGRTDAFGFDSGKLDQVYQDLLSEDPQQRNQALRMLAQFGSEDVIEDLVAMAKDEHEDGEARRLLMEEIDWSGRARHLAEIIEISKDPEVRLSAITVIRPGSFQDEGLHQLEAALLDNLKSESSDGVKIATLNYFAATDPASFQSILSQFERELSSPEVQRHLKFISTPPEELSRVVAEEVLPEW